MCATYNVRGAQAFSSTLSLQVAVTKRYILLVTLKLVSNRQPHGNYQVYLHLLKQPQAREQLNNRKGMGREEEEGKKKRKERKRIQSLSLLTACTTTAAVQLPTRMQTRCRSSSICHASCAT